MNIKVAELETSSRAGHKLEKQSEALVPPNPKEFVSAILLENIEVMRDTCHGVL